MPTDNSAEIAKIDELLNTGATAVEIDGVKVAIDQDALRRRRTELASEDSTLKKRRRLLIPIATGRFAP